MSPDDGPEICLGRSGMGKWKTLFTCGFWNSKLEKLCTCLKLNNILLSKGTVCSVIYIHSYFQRSSSSDNDIDTHLRHIIILTWTTIVLLLTHNSCSPRTRWYIEVKYTASSLFPLLSSDCLHTPSSHKNHRDPFSLEGVILVKKLMVVQLLASVFLYATVAHRLSFSACPCHN